MSFETLREKRFFSFPLIALVRLHGWITKDSNRNAVQRGGTSPGEGEAPRWVMCLCVFPSFSLSFTLCQLLWVSITPQSKWMVWEGLLQRVKPPLLMSPVFNHHTVEWFYAYFICISLNRVSKGRSEPGEVQSWGEREEKKVPMMLIFKRGLVP